MTDLDRLKELVARRPVDGEKELEALYQQYACATPPKKGETVSVAYRIRLLILDRWNLWKRLVMYRQWQGSGGEHLDGTNNRCEQAIGNWIKERYRTMRGYKREESAVGVSRLLVWAGNHTLRGGAPLVLLLK